MYSQKLTVSQLNLVHKTKQTLN